MDSQISNLQFANCLERISGDLHTAGKFDLSVDLLEAANRLSSLSTKIYDLFSLVDDGTMDVIIQSANGNEYRYDCKYVVDYRDDDGVLDFERLIDDHLSFNRYGCAELD